MPRVEPHRLLRRGWSGVPHLGERGLFEQGWLDKLTTDLPALLADPAG